MTVKADDKLRVRLPNAKPGQVFAYDPQADGSVLLIPVKEERQERPLDAHLYDDYPAERLALEDAMARIPAPAGDRG